MIPAFVRRALRELGGWLIALSEADLRRIDWQLVGLAAATVVLQAAFVVSWIVAGALEPHYSALDSYVSELGALTAKHAWIVNAGIVAFGASFIILSLAVSRSLPKGRWRLVASATFAVIGLAVATTGFLRLDCIPSLSHACQARADAGVLSWHHYAHGWIAFGSEVLAALSPIPLLLALRPGLLRQLCAGCAAFGIAALAVTVAGAQTKPVDGAGLVQRLGFGVLHAWTLLVLAAMLLASAIATAPRQAATSGG